MHKMVLFILSFLIITMLQGCSKKKPPAKQENMAAKSPEQIDWEKQVHPLMSGHPAFDYIEDDSNLPRVLLIGDSISIGYTVPVRELLAGKVNVHRIPTNGGPTISGLLNLSQWLGDKKWDIIYFNWGGHDIMHIKDEKLDDSGNIRSTPEQYEKNLEELVQQLKATKAKLIFATTTPLPEEYEGFVNNEEVEYNSIAIKIMKKHDIAISDLYTYILPHIDELRIPHDPHYTEQGYIFLAQQVAGQILDTINKK